MQCEGYGNYLLYSGCYWQKYFCKNENFVSLGGRGEAWVVVVGCVGVCVQLHCELPQTTFLLQTQSNLILVQFPVKYQELQCSP